MKLSPKIYALGGKIMLRAIIVLFLVFIFMVILRIYARWHLLRIRRRRYLNGRHRYLNGHRNSRQRATNIIYDVDPNSSTYIPTPGLEASIINSLPVFIYSSQTHPDAIDCAVCLSEFEENEKGRILPKCHHSFHAECIDKWFHAHSTCPICRAQVEAQVPVQPPQNIRSELIVSIDEGLDAEPAGSSSAVSSTSMADRRKRLDLAAVRIEVPRRSESVDELKLSSPSSHGFKSQESRLHPFRGTLNMNRRSVDVSSTSEIGTSGGSMGTEFDTKLATGESSHGQAQVNIDTEAPVATAVSK